MLAFVWDIFERLFPKVVWPIEAGNAEVGISRYADAFGVQGVSNGANGSWIVVLVCDQ